jgi:hypothetical protein
MMSKLKSYAINLSYEVPSEEKDQAEKALMAYDILTKKLKTCDEHLDLIYSPFKNNPNITPEQVYKVRASLRRYRDKVADNFNVFKRIAFRCFVLMQVFSSDTQIVKFNKSFVVAIGDIEKQVNRFIELFSNLESKDFAAIVVKSIENIKKETAQLDQIIEDRIKPYIENNILAINWTDSVSEELQEKVEKRVPLTVRLVEEREGSNNQALGQE